MRFGLHRPAHGGGRPEEPREEPGEALPARANARWGDAPRAARARQGEALRADRARRSLLLRAARARRGAGRVALVLALLAAAPATATEVVIRHSTRLPIVLDLINPFASRADVRFGVTVDPIVGVGITGLIPPWNVTNQGTVRGRFFSHDAIFLTGGSLTNGLGGVVDGDGDGVQIDGLFGATVHNAGSIRGRNGSGVFLPAGGTVTNTNGALIEGATAGVRTCCGSGRVENRGTITGSTGVLLGAGGRVDNLGASARIVGGSGPGISAANGSLDVENGGSVESHAAFGIDMAWGSVQNDTGGIIRGGAGGIRTASDTRVLNRGLIAGPWSIAFGGGDDTLTLDTGSELQGTADGGGGQDSVVLRGSGREDDAFTGFEQLRMEGSDWTLSGSSQFADAVQTGGVLRIEGTLAAPTTVTGGTLELTGRIEDDTTIGPEGRLVGTGTTGNLANAGTVAPGFSIGTLQVDGDYTEQPGSSLEVEVDDTGASDRLVVTGSANLGGGNVVATADAGGYVRTLTYTILTAAGGVNGTYAGLIEEFPFVDGTLGYGPNVVTLTGFRNSNEFDTVARCPNQVHTANALDAAERDPLATADMQLALEALVGSADAASARRYLDEVGAPGRPDVSYVNLEQLRSFQEAVTSRSNVLLLEPGLPGASFAAAGGRHGPVSAAGGGQGGLQGWLRGVGLLGNRDGGDCPAEGYRYDLGGGAFGLDTRLGRDFGIGLAGAGGYGNAHVKGVSDHIRAWHAHGALYGAWVPDAGRDLRVASALTLGWIQNDTARAINVRGFDRQALGTLDSFALSWAVEASGIAARVAGVAIRPLLGLQLLHLSEGSIQERNAGALDLDFDARSLDSLRSELGLQAARRFALSDGWSLEAGVDAAWSHEYLSLDDGVGARFSGSPASGFEVVGDAPERDRALVGGGLVLQHQEHLFLSARYLAALAGDETWHAIQAGFRLAW